MIKRLLQLEVSVSMVYLFFFNCLIFSSTSCWAILKKIIKLLCVPDPLVLRVTVLLQPYFHREEILQNRPPSVHAVTVTLMQSAN